MAGQHEHRANARPMYSLTQHQVVAQGQMSNKLLDSFLIRPQASAKARMYIRLARKKPFMSGKAVRRSCAGCSITLAPQPSRMSAISSTVAARLASISRWAPMRVTAPRACERRSSSSQGIAWPSTLRP